MLIAHISDSHIELPEPQGAGRCNNFEQVIAHINSLGTTPDMIIHTGDISHCDRRQEYQFAAEQLGRCNIPFQVIPGNKDSRAGMAEVFDTGDTFIQKCIDTQNWRLLLLDTASTQSNKGAFCAQRMEWLKAQLEKNQRPVSLFMHHPSFYMTQNPYPFQFESQQVADEFNALISGYPQIKAVFCGHAHRTTYENIGHIPAMTLTAMSLDRRKGTYDEKFDGKPIYQLIELKPDGAFETHLQAAG